MNPLRRLRRERYDPSALEADGLDTAELWGAQPAPAASLPEASVYIAVPPDDLGEHRRDVALDLAAFYNTLREGEISEEHALALTQAFFPRGRWG